ncbi:polysaccharide lyase [Aromatoleum sp.]|uniref:polysaccharide lyase n=1 Tax=Aromatoleum sp. TaxID=2307007 RepID=UPI002FC6BBAF
MMLGVSLRFGFSLATLGLGLPAEATPVPLSDGPDGMSCYYYASGMRMAWRQPGGDWVDAAGKAHGDEAYSVARVGRAKQRQTVSWDLTELAKQWGAKERLPGALFLRALDAGRSGVVNLASREAQEVGPVLVIDWEGGRSTRLAPVADVHFSCPNSRSDGKRKVMQVGHRYMAVVVFPFERKGDQRVARATLEMSSDKQYDGGAKIGIFSPLLPWFEPGEPRTGFAAAHPSDRGIAADPNVIFADDFESGDWRSKWTRHSPHSNSETVRADGGDLFEPFAGKALKVTVEKGKRLGLGMHYRFEDHPAGEPEEAFFRYYLRFGDSWNPTTGGKLPGLAGTYDRAGWGGRRADGVNGWSTRGSFFPRLSREMEFEDLRGIGSYVYHAGMDSEYGDSWGWSLGPSGALKKNRWYAVEQQVRLNTPGEANGILRAWVDGRLVFEKLDMRFRDVPDLKIESLWMNVYHGGTARAKSDLVLYIDNVVVAREYIGPMVRP